MMKENGDSDLLSAHHHRHDHRHQHHIDLLNIIARFSTSWIEILFFLFITPLLMSSTFTFKVIYVDD